MTKSADAFRTISEVADWLNTPAHVLRFWESKFAQVKPVKRAGGRRYYRPTDMKLLGGIKRLLHDDGMTIKGVQKLLREQGMAHVAGLSQPLGDAADDVEVADLVIDGQAQPVEEESDLQSAVAPDTPSDDAPPESAAAPDAPPQSAFEEQAEAQTDAVSEERPSDVTPESPANAPAPLEDETPADDTPADDTPADDTPVMPSFRSRQQDSPVTPPDQTEPEQATKPALQVIEIPDLPDDPGDDAPADPGPLAALARLPRQITPELAQELQRIAAALRAAGGSGGRQ